jgi:hypothetical protein
LLGKKGEAQAGLTVLNVRIVASDSYFNDVSKFLFSLELIGGNDLLTDTSYGLSELVLIAVGFR